MISITIMYVVARDHTPVLGTNLIIHLYYDYAVAI